MDAAWETMKAARRGLSHDAAVAETARLQRQYRKQWSGRMASSGVELHDILRALSDRKVPFVLTGAHAIGGWTGRPRNTYDVDILVKSGRNYSRAVSTIKALYPKLETHPFTGGIGFFVSGETSSVIDVMVPHRADLAETIATAIWIDNEELGIRYRIPTLEAALASKYGAMLTPNRDPAKRALDSADFAFMVKHAADEGQRPIDLNQLRSLGEMVWPDGGGDEIIGLVEEVGAMGFVDLARLLKRN
jgi:hypothetical protein